jgi:hypothetical protein
MPALTRGPRTDFELELGPAVPGVAGDNVIRFLGAELAKAGMIDITGPGAGFVHDVPACNTPE